jgi:beta-N-acetylhexosaminidase
MNDINRTIKKYRINMMVRKPERTIFKKNEYMRKNFIRPLILILPVLVTFLLSDCKVAKNNSAIPDKASKTKSVPKLNPEKTANYSLDTKIGQMIMIGINDRTKLTSTDPLKEEIINNKAGGIILFEKNINPSDSKANLKKLISDLQEKSSIPLFISVDEEGGKVHRLKEKYGFVKMPSAAYLGSINNLDSTLYYTEKLAVQLKELGINLNYAPVVDLALNKNNPVISKADRSYSSDPEIVSRQALTSIEGHHKYNIKTIIKHFPGHGSSSVDSHLGITDVSNNWRFIELTPYNRIIKSGTCDAIMSAHIINCHLDTNCLPATLSKVMITDILRGLLDFKGVVFSDDMQMYAISKNYGLEKAIKLSIMAGVDVLVFGNNVNLNDRITASEIHVIIKGLVKSGEISENRINESFNRIKELKKKKF